MYVYKKYNCMKSGYISLIIELVICFLVGITWTSCQKTDHEDVVQLKVINKNAPIEVELYDLVDSIQYTALETSDSCLLGEIINVKKVDGYYFVRDNFGLYAFDENGKFVNEVSQKGNGQKEYVQLDNFYIDEERKLVGLICNVSKKIMFFTYDGMYHSTVYMKEEDCGISSMMQGPHQELLVCYPIPNNFNNVPFEYKRIRIRHDSLVTDPLIPMKDLTTKDIYYAFFSHPMALYKDTCLLLSVLSHNIYAVQDGKVNRTYQYDLFKALPDGKELERYKGENFYGQKEKIKSSGKSIGLTGIQTNGDYVFISVNDENILIWDGKQSVLIQNVYDSRLDHYFYNIVLSGGCADENIGFYTADFLCQLKGSLLPRNDALRQIVDTVEEDDNPVLYQFVFKKNLVNQLIEKYKLSL